MDDVDIMVVVISTIHKAMSLKVFIKVYKVQLSRIVVYSNIRCVHIRVWCVTS